VYRATLLKKLLTFLLGSAASRSFKKEEKKVEPLQQKLAF
jgi:hypothetical protein